MSVKDIRREFERLADRGTITEARVMPLTLSLVMESAVQAFHQAYFGELLSTEIQNVRGMDHQATDNAMRRAEGLIGDMTAFRKVHTETHTTSDFPLALANARQAAQRPAYTYPESDLLNFAARRTADNFKALKSNRPGSLGHRVLPVRPESTNLQYGQFYTTQDGYTVANYELGLEYTWEAYRNDEMGDFVAAAADLGATARRTRAWVLLDAIFSRADRITVPTPADGPSIANLDAVADYFALRQVNGRATPRVVSDLFVPTNLARKARRTVDTEFTAPMIKNPVYQLGAVHLEDLITEFAPEYGLGANAYIAMDGRAKPLEFAALRGYEGGPKTFTRVVDVQETDMEGNFENHIAAMKVSDNCGGTIRDESSVVIVEDD
ncbi:hypothetical protein QR90_06725 [Deinococcus radiopugnans]|uniref:Major capsid protein n=1 Tax=Deinococcus radiopugnans TaxID=57497 RepID=A0A0A7KK12_9DEIO|nr:hypothetical protein [Deinococcus radiopugnans]AIZ44863.1 hypothetical protein QR90_06725 [Deinococcus radiopugnans]